MISEININFNCKIYLLLDAKWIRHKLLRKLRVNGIWNFIFYVIF